FQMVGCQTSAPAKSDLSDEKVEKIEADQNALIVSAIENGEPEKGLLMARRLLQVRKGDPELYNLQGLCYMALKNSVAAIQAFRKAYNTENKPAFALNLSAALV